MLYQGQVQKNLLKLVSSHLPQTAKDSHYVVDPIKKQLNKNHREIGSSSLCYWWYPQESGWMSQELTPPNSSQNKLRKQVNTKICFQSCVLQAPNNE